MQLAFILGTRPEIIKFSPIITRVQSLGIPFDIIHTNQHYDPNMDSVFFSDLNLPQPTYQLRVGSDSPLSQVGRMLIELEKVFTKLKPDVILVQGDTNTVLAGGLAGSKLGIPIAHVEAGLRSFDRTMPEEINRIVVDHLSSYLFCPTDKQAELLHSEQINSDYIYVTGNTIVDATLNYSQQAIAKSSILAKLGISGNFIFLTCHRPSNTNNSAHLNTILTAVSGIAEKEDMPVVFPVHPRLGVQRTILQSFPRLILTDPLGYFDSLALQIKSRMIFTDSGGIQEEACILQRKCLILRTNTERPETLEVGGAEILPEISVEAIQQTYDRLQSKQVKWFNPFGDGKSAHKITDILLKQHGQ